MKYFIQKSQKIVLTGILFLLFQFCLVHSESGLIKQVVFLSEEQTVGVGEISGPIIVQTQNASGEAEKISETNDIYFSSTSGSGEFLGSTGNPVTTTMSKNTSSRTFFYRDSKEGVHTIQIEIIGRESGEKFKATQEITVGKATGSNQFSSKDTTESQTASGISAHQNQKDLATVSSSQGFKVDAGRPRVISIHTPLDFNAEVSGLKKSAKRLRFDWSFGDGTAGRGKEISHTYQFPGEYIVVVNGYQDDEYATSRIDVKVVDPQIEIVNVSAGLTAIEVRNNSNEEINLGGWLILSGQEKFIIAKDTIIKPRSKLHISTTFSNQSDKVTLFYPTGSLAYEHVLRPRESGDALRTARTNMLLELVSLKKELAKNNLATADTEAVVEQFETETEIKDEEVKSDIKKEEYSDQTAALLEAVEVKEDSILKKMVHFLKTFFD